MRRLAAAAARPRRALFRRPLTDRGSGAIVVVFFALVVLGLAAFVVDGGLSIAQRERAADIAEQAARYAVQDLDEEALRAGVTPVPVNIGNCANRVAEYAASVELTSASVSRSSCTPLAANRVLVDIEVTYRPVFSGMFYSRPLTVSGTATAEARTG
ncbi:pilus assembly protein TadG-related protein [Streptomyces sodiiphilus]|uniref:Pilus assembly protein TadG-related protein n=1 Tax=Streptomyces sodiiphilus TaxID=226217 RepID=A0ABN2NWF0_9ACTN